MLLVMILVLSGISEATWARTSKKLKANTHCIPFASPDLCDWLIKTTRATRASQSALTCLFFNQSEAKPKTGREHGVCT